MGAGRPEALAQQRRLPRFLSFPGQVGVLDDPFIRHPKKGLEFASESDAKTPPVPFVGGRGCFLHPFADEIPLEQSPFRLDPVPLYLTRGSFLATRERRQKEGDVGFCLRPQRVHSPTPPCYPAPTPQRRSHQFKT